MKTTTLLNENLLFALHENSYEAICLLDEELTPFYRSPSASQITGYTLEERQVFNFISDIHPDDNEKWQQAIRDTKANPCKPIFFTIRLKHKKGHYIILEVVYSNFLNDENVGAIICNMRDITDRVEIKEILDRKIRQITDYKYALDQSSIVAVANKRGIIKFVNDNFCKISKYSREELIGQDQWLIMAEYHTAEFLQNVWKTIAGGKVWKGEIKSQTKDGTFYWTETTIVPFLDENGSPWQHMTIRTDITEKKKSETQIAKMVMRLKQAQETARVGSWEHDFATGKVMWSDEACRIHGIPGENIQSLETWASFLHPQDKERVMKIIETSKANLTDASFKHRILLKDGTVKHIHSISKYEFDKKGNPVSVIGTCRDITESVKANEQLKKTLLRLKQAQETAHLGSWERSLDSDKLIFSDEMCRIHDFQGENVKTFEEFASYIHPEDREEVIQAIKKSNETFSDGSVEHRVVLKDGSIKHLYSERKFEFDEHGKAIGVIGISLDITKRKEAEKSLLHSKNLFREFFESAPEAIGIVDIDTGKFVDFNTNALKLFKYSREEFLQKTPADISPKFQPDGRDSQFAAIEFIGRAMAGEKISFEWLHCDSQGREFICEVRLTRISVPGGKDLLRGSMIDISEKKEAEKKIHDISQRLLLATNSAKIGIFDWDLIANKLVWDDNMYALYKISPDTKADPVEISKRALHPEDRQKIAADMEDALKGIREFHSAFKIILPNNEIRHTEAHAIILKDKEGKPFRMIGANWDVTQQKLAEEKIVQSESRIRTFARHLNKVQEEERSHLAREIHDELGQQLVGIKIGLASLIKISSEETVKEMIMDVDNAIQSLRKIATELRPGILDSLGLIPSIKWLGSEFEKKTGIICEMNLNIPEQMFEKCVSTACFRICQEALTNISKHAGATIVNIEMLYDKNELLLKIEDNGKGIFSEKLENPFSMGLLGMRERASTIGGNLQISSEKNKGTKIQLTVLINQAC